MKQMLLIIACLVSLTLQAQKSASVSLNIRLYPIQTLVVNTNQQTVNLDYVTKSDYENGVTSKQVDHLSVFSTGGFEIKIKGNELINTSRSISAQDVFIQPYDGSNALSGVTYHPVDLNGSETLIISSDKGGVDNTFSIDYSAKGDFKYLDLYRYSDIANVFSTSVIYVINPK